MGPTKKERAAYPLIEPTRAYREEEMKSLILAGTAAAAIALADAPAVAWEPTKPVEIVVAAGAGGASDQMARMADTPNREMNPTAADTLKFNPKK